MGVPNIMLDILIIANYSIIASSMFFLISVTSGSDIPSTQSGTGSSQTGAMDSKINSTALSIGGNK